MIKIIKTGTQDCHDLAILARSIWLEHYTPIIGIDQVEYMLGKFQNEQAIKDQILDGVDYYLVKSNQHNIGYMALKQRANHLFISKFYLAEACRGQGIAHLMLNKVKEIALSMGLEKLELTVNKYNFAYQAYLKMGFENIDSIETDIGNGYIMDDYVMVKAV